MENNSYLEEWLSKDTYLCVDVFDDDFAINFEKTTIRELVEKGFIELPNFNFFEEDDPF